MQTNARLKAGATYAKTQFSRGRLSPFFICVLMSRLTVRFVSPQEPRPTRRIHEMAWSSAFELKQRRMNYPPRARQPRRARTMPRATILIDADDTLWENNVFFEKTIEEFLTLLEPFGYAPDYARHILNETERRNIRQHGYGVRSLARALEETSMKLARPPAAPATGEAAQYRVRPLEPRPPSNLDGQGETLDYLLRRPCLS